MKQIRNNIFETNSSSTHSVSLTNMSSDILNFEQLDSYVDQADHYIHIEFGEFGWGYDEYVDAYMKLQYLLTMIMELHRNELLTFDDFYNLDEFILVECIVTENVKDCKGICIANDCFKRNSYDSEDKDGNPITKYWNSFNGYIDHQSYEDYETLADFLDNWCVTLEDFIFNENVELIIDNDNH